jgi:hypothetical protein
MGMRKKIAKMTSSDTQKCNNNMDLKVYFSRFLRLFLIIVRSGFLFKKKPFETIFTICYAFVL